MAPTAEEVDQLFMMAAERSGGIDPLLKAFFGFLHRRTDFYVVHDGAKGVRYEAGFADGQAEAMAQRRRGPYASRDGAGRYARRRRPGEAFRGGGLRYRRGCHVDSPRRRVAAPPRVPRG